MARSLVLMDASEPVLSKLLLTGTVTVTDLVRQGAKPADRREMAAVSGLRQEELYDLVKQADLLRVDELEPSQATLLLKAGLRGVADLADCSPDKLLERLKQLAPPNQLPSLDEVRSWKLSAGTLKPGFVPDTTDRPPSGLLEAEPARPTEQMFSDMVEMVINLGRGIAQAQQEMDEQTIRTQKLINSDARLRGMGLMATWFTIPDATFNLKMNYSLVRQEGEEPGGTGRQQFLLTPLNARTQNYFKLSEGMSSELSIRFASLPPPIHISQPVVVPSVIGTTLEQARSQLQAANLRAGTVATVPGDPAGGAESEVTAQNPEPGSEARFQDRINLFVRKAAAPA